MMGGMEASFQDAQRKSTEESRKIEELAPGPSVIPLYSRALKKGFAPLLSRALTGRGEVFSFKARWTDRGENQWVDYLQGRDEPPRQLEGSMGTPGCGI